MKNYKLMVLLILLISSGCVFKPTHTISEEVLMRKYKAVEAYAQKEREKVVIQVEKQKERANQELKNIDALVDMLHKKMDSNDFISLILNEKETYFKQEKNLTNAQMKHLTEYFDKKVETLKVSHATFLKETLRKKNQKNHQDVMPFYKDGILVVNKKHPLPQSYAPGENPVAAKKIKELIKEMQSKGMDISNSYSGFRNYALQSTLYNRYVKRDGKAFAETYSARPGHSEHQSGLAFDVLHKNGTLVKNEPEATWIHDNAAQYGFIVRYQKGKEKITGYRAEPWHLRYIGKQAQEIMDSGLSLEEFIDVTGGDYVDALAG